MYCKSRVLPWKSSSVDMFRSGSVKETSLHINIAGGGKRSKLTSLLEVTFFSAAKLTNTLRLFQMNRPNRMIAVKSFKTDQNLFIFMTLKSLSLINQIKPKVVSYGRNNSLRQMYIM